MDAIEMACYAMRRDSYIPYTEDFLNSPRESTESIIIKRDLYERLSEDSKNAVRILIDGPQEAVKNMNTLRKYMYENGISYRKSTRIFNELKSFIKEIIDV